MQDPALVAPQTQAFGAYQIVDLIGRGAHTVVYRAYQPALGRWVALKLLPVPPEHAEFVARFQRVAETAARLEHPNILAIQDYGQQGGVPYLVMPYVSGGTLAQRLPANAPRDWALGILLQVCGALAYAHRQRVVHGDVTPNNVLLRDQHWALLSDFGLARLLGTLGPSGSGALYGTPEYMAPEQAQGAPLDPRVDVYAVGVLLYRVLAGALPFSGAAGAQVLAHQARAPVPPLRLPDPEVARIWDAVLARALAKSLADRYANAADLAAAIQTAMQQERAVAVDGAPTAPARGGALAAGAGIEGQGGASLAPGSATHATARAAAVGRLASGHDASDGTRVTPRPGRRERARRDASWLQGGRRWPLVALGVLLGLVILVGTLVGPRGGATSPHATPGALAPLSAPATATAPAASAAPTAGAAEPRVILRDDFANVDSGWPRQSSDTSTRRVGYVEGEYAIVKVAGSQGAPFVSHDVEVADFRWDLDARLLAPTANAYVYLDFRRQENGDHYSYVVDPNDSTFRLERVVGETRRELLPWTRHAAIQAGTARNRLGVRAAGPEIVLLANGEEVARVHDDALTAGAIAFGIGSFQNGQAEARFDNLLLTALPGRS